MDYSRSIGKIAAIGVVFAVLAIGALVLFANGGTDTPSDAGSGSAASTSSSSSTPQVTTTTTATDLAAGDVGDQTADDVGDEVEPRFILEGELPLSNEEVNDMMAFVEEQTGRGFLYPPTIVAQSKADYEAGLAEDLKEELEEFEESVDQAARYYQATGLSDMGAAELGNMVREALSDADGVLGYYVPEEDKLFVPTDSGATDGFRSTVVHELVHAHDGQHVDLFKYSDELDEDDGEGQFARGSVVEGRARSVENRWVEANPPAIPDSREELTDDQLALLSSLPPVFWNEILLPYELGVQFIEINGGPAETWGFYEDPPASSEQVLAPYEQADEPVAVSRPSADGDEIFRGTYGAVDLLLLLISATAEPGIDTVVAAIGAADGWGGGEAVIWGDDAESCVRIVLAGDSGTDLEEIRAVLTEWADTDTDRTVDSSADDRVQVTACGPYRP